MPAEASHRQVCLITGGSSGIGLAAAKLFARQGYDVSICGRNEARLTSARKKILEANPKIDCVTHQADLTDVEQTLNVAEKTIKRFGHVDVLVNNAASSPLSLFDEIPADVFEEAINTNIRSLFYLTQLVWKHMKGQGGGVVINISSLSAIDPVPGFQPLWSVQGLDGSDDSRACWRG